MDSRSSPKKTGIEALQNDINVTDIQYKVKDQAPFTLQKVILQNVITVEDDRPDIPVLSVNLDNQHLSVQFAIIQFK